MILQDLLRNIVLYNGIFNPYLQSVKEYILTFLSLSYKHQEELLLASEADLPHKLSILASLPATGTRTFSERELVISSQIVTENTIEKLHSLESGNQTITVLMNDGIDITGKTHSDNTELGIDISENVTFSSPSITTGSINEYIQLFFSSETHEKREYLGEFSLTHEEIHFNSLMERG
jgi:hypothetical protein